MIAASQTGEPSPTARIWSMLPEKTRSLILRNPVYIKLMVQNQLVSDLNALLRRRDLYTSTLWHSDSLPPEAAVLLA